MTTLWTEKYRPKKIEDFICPPHLKNFLITHKENFPHLLLYGPPGTGKTTFAHLIAHKSKLELNASHERGINVIRTTVKNFASSVSTKNTIILDECELLTADAQQCLRRIIEDFTNTKFIFITNYPSKIILPLKSRLLALKFDFDNKEALRKIKEENEICVDENLLLKFCNFDLRKAINILQGIKPLKNINLEEIMGYVNNDVLFSFWDIKKDFKSFVDEFLRNNYCILTFLNQLADSLLEMKDDLKRALFLLEMSKIEEKAALGGDDEILLTLLCLKKIEIFN